MTGIELLLLGFAFLLFGAVVTALLGRWATLNGWVAFIFGLIGNLLTIIASLRFLIGERRGTPPYLVEGISLDTIFYVDRLGAFFIFIISALSILSLL
ncbi:MAG: hypothetical protein ACPLPS_03930, partial [bacterium]